MTENNENEFIPFADRVGNNLNRRKLTIVSQTPNEMIVDVTREDSDITSEGSKLTASKLNEVFNEIKSELNSQDKGTKVKINGIGQEELNFTSDPQAQITNIVNNTSKISNTNGGFSAGNGAECSIDAIQLGAGTNSIPKSLKVYSDDIYDANNHKLGSALLNAIYPIGAIYISVNSTSPTILFGGTWEALDEGYAFWTTTTAGTGGETIAAGLPNIVGNLNVVTSYNNYSQDLGLKGAFTKGADVGFKVATYENQMVSHYPLFNASNGECGTQELTEPNKSITYDNKVYGKSETVQPPAIKVYAWKRTA